MAKASNTVRVGLALCLAAFAAGFPPLRVAVLHWIFAAELVPGMASSAGENERL